MRWPNTSQVANDLREINHIRIESDVDAIDVRLQVHDDGAWSIHSGDASYDTDHRGYWGAASVPGNSEKFNSTAVAKDLIDQAKEDHATSNPEGENLDGLWPDELERIARTAKNATYRKYAKLKAQAMRARESGQITRALALESELERLYPKLPDQSQVVTCGWLRLPLVTENVTQDLIGTSNRRHYNAQDSRQGNRQALRGCHAFAQGQVNQADGKKKARRSPKRRKHHHCRGRAKVEHVMREFYHGDLTSHGHRVARPDVAKAIAMSEGRAASARKPKRRVKRRKAKRAAPRSAESSSEQRSDRARRRRAADRRSTIGSSGTPLQGSS